MVKKKRQSEPDEQGDDSTESCEENLKCPHIAKAINLTSLKKILKAHGFAKECTQCIKSPAKIESDPAFEVDLSLWMCLKCGSQLCGRARNEHALNHYRTPHSDCHSMVVNTSSWDVYCYNCNNEVSPAGGKKLLECIEYLKKQSNVCSIKPERENQLAELAERFARLSQPAESSGGGAPSLQRVRGLSNLGNTCFFNSVMQCLVQTPYLLPVLRQMADAGEQFTLPGGPLRIELRGEEPQDLHMPVIEGQLSEWGPLTRTLAETLEELQTQGKADVFTPSRLLSALVSKLPQFGGGDQHDSHELLRHLLEAVRSEDLRRYQAVILANLGLSKKIDPSKVQGEMKQKVKFYGQQASDTMLRPEQVFRGFLVSTLECQDCFHTSDTYEYFLDLSLPVAADRPQPPAVRRKTPAQDETFNCLGASEENKLSKHQLKKAARKARKSKSGSAKGNSSKITGGEASNNADEILKDGNKSSSEQSDADVEDNLDENPKSREPQVSVYGPQNDASNSVGGFYMESGYNSEKVISSDSVRASPTQLESKEKSDDTPEAKDKDKTIFPETVSVACSATAIPLEYKPLSYFDNLWIPDSGVASPDATKNNSSEAVDNVESLVNGKNLGSPSSLSSELNLELSNPQLRRVATDDNDSEGPVSFPGEPSNEVIMRGISAEGTALLKFGPKTADEHLLDTRAGCSNNFDKNFTSPGPLNFDEDLTFSHRQDTKPKSAYPVSLFYSGTNEDESPTSYGMNSDPSKLNHGDVDILRKDYSPFSYRPTTVSPRYTCDEGECSIQSCLNQFTALELLTGNNKVGCESCTKKINGEGGKTIYTNATKRFLVSSPPAVLILHLKRFQLGPRCMFRKMTKHVNFPLVLDLAPFCLARKIRKLPNVAPGQTKLLYSLYGVVEHSGGMHGGHYVAYVKVRPPVQTEDKRWRFLPTGGNIEKDDTVEENQSNGDADDDSDSSLSGYESGEGACGGAEEPTPPPGKWFYISDSRVQDISEDKVLRAQAYLLFYERIL